MERSLFCIRPKSAIPRVMASQIENLEQPAGTSLPASWCWPTEQNNADFMEITQDVFGDAQFGIEKDPDSGEICYVAKVWATGNNEEVDATSNRWHSRIVDELPDCVGRLVIDVRFR